MNFNKNHYVFKQFLLILILIFVCQIATAQNYIHQIDESQIHYLKSEDVFVLDLIQNYESPTDLQLKRFAEIKELKTITEQEIIIEIDKLSKKMRYLDTFNYVLDEPFYVSLKDLNTNSFKLSRENGLLLPKNIFIGNINNYSYFYQILTVIPKDIEINTPKWLANKFFENFDNDPIKRIEVGVTITTKPEFNIASIGKGYITIRVLELKAWYNGKVICTYTFNDREESTSVFNVKGVPITTHWKLLNGIPATITEAFYPNGKLYSKGSYFDASFTAQHGSFEYFDQEGNLIRKENFYKGVPEGEFYDLYYSKMDLSSIVYKRYDQGSLICHESINIISGKPRRTTVSGKCDNDLVEKLLQSLLQK